MLKNLNELRMKAGLSYGDLAKIIGHSKSAVFNWENEFLKINSEDLIKLSDYFKVSIDYLLDREEESHRINELMIELEKISPDDIKKFIREKLEASLNEKSDPQE